MPNQRLPHPTKMTEADAVLKLALLHLRSGKRRLQKGHPRAGIVALYDSVLFGMRYYIATHKGCGSFVEHTELWDAASLFHALTRAGVFENPLTFNRFNLMVERALWQRSFPFDGDVALAEVESILTKLGVMPFNEYALSAESPVPHSSETDE